MSLVHPISTAHGGGADRSKQQVQQSRVSLGNSEPNLDRHRSLGPAPAENVNLTGFASVFQFHPITHENCIRLQSRPFWTGSGRLHRGRLERPGALYRPVQSAGSSGHGRVPSFSAHHPIWGSGNGLGRAWGPPHGFFFGS